ncbi:hypothetical protein [Trujillonella endophytica]|uniref:DUF4239 domain-containing protein n=1 Tax=Trujillonella endophytica TaxID=673521 RepID=A0A1H8QMT4_9ACTN|nr:hypothetical protein [Trujillella endophytica]SEO55267.1 hypothetical protein SAMN05660991_00683 [Trujillella endophytica]
MLFFGLSTWVLALVLAAVMAASVALGLVVGRRLATRSVDLREPLGVLQGALIGFMGLILAFGLSLAVGRYENRRTDVVAEANAIGTTYLRAQTLAEPVRSQSLDLLRDYADESIRIADERPGSDAQRDAVDDSQELQRALWGLAGQALDAAPANVAPQLYIESLNEMFDAQAGRVAGLGNRVPSAVILLEVVGAALALAVLALHLATFGRGIATVSAAAALVTLLLVVTFDLDRPTRGLIRVPSTPLDAVAATMAEPPAVEAPQGP